MAEVITKDGLHDVRGYHCDFCGELCDPDICQLNALDCTFPQCPTECSVYHQDCLEKYLKSIRLEKNRKTGFKCPRGCGKASKHDPCPGKIDKSHPIHMRNETKQKKKELPPPVLEKPKPKAAAKLPAPQNAKLEKEKKEKEKEAAKLPPAKGALDKATAKKGTAAPSTSALAAAAAAARAELKLKNGAAQVPARAVVGKAAVQRELQTLDEFELARQGGRAGTRQDAPSQNAWGAASLAKVSSASTLDISSEVAFPAPQAARGGAPAQDPPVYTVPQATWLPNPSITQAPAPATPGRTAATTTPVGGELEEHLTRAQRKNQRRAERKAQLRVNKEVEPGGGAADAYDETSEVASDGGRPSGSGDGESDGSPVGPPSNPPLADASGGGRGVPAWLEETLLETLQGMQARFLVGVIQEFGYPDYQARTAIALHGSDLLSAFTFVLEGRGSTEEQANALLANVTHVPYVDIQPRLQTLANAQRVHGLQWEALAMAVVECRGDIEAAVATLFDRAEQNGGAPVTQPAPANEQSQLSSLFSTMGHQTKPAPVGAQLGGVAGYSSLYSQQGGYGAQLPLPGPSPVYPQANAMGNGGTYTPLSGVSGGFGGLALGVETGSGWGVARPGVIDLPGAYVGGQHNASGVNPAAGAGMIGRLDSTASLANAESASTWSADSGAAFARLPTQGAQSQVAQPGLQSHRLHSEGSFSTQGSHTPLSRQNSGGLSFAWANQVAGSAPHQVGHTPFAEQLQGQAAVDALFANPQPFSNVGVSPFSMPPSGLSQARDTSLPLFARVTANAQANTAFRDVPLPLYARGNRAPSAEPPALYGGNAGDRGSLWAQSGHPPWGFPPPKPSPQEDAVTEEDLESLMAKLLDPN